MIGVIFLAFLGLLLAGIVVPMPHEEHSHRFRPLYVLVATLVLVVLQLISR